MVWPTDVDRKNDRKRNRTVIIAAVVIALSLLLLVVWCLWGNSALICTEYTVTSDRLPDSFDGFRIAQISDLHNAEFGKNNAKLLNMLQQQKPDMIALTGDMICSYRTDMDAALRFAKEAVKIAPCYFVTGNHEARVPQWKQFIAELEAVGVDVLYDEKAWIERNGEKIAVLGVNDHKFETYSAIGDQIDLLMVEGCYHVLLSHRPDYMSTYYRCGVDLALSGHAHGGQIRLPYIGGIYAPGQGWLPQYDGGIYAMDTTTMVVSRGLGNSAFPLRINNRPEIVMIELKKVG